MSYQKHHLQPHAPSPTRPGVTNDDQTRQKQHHNHKQHQQHPPAHPRTDRESSPRPGPRAATQPPVTSQHCAKQDANRLSRLSTARAIRHLLRLHGQKHRTRWTMNEEVPEVMQHVWLQWRPRAARQLPSRPGGSSPILHDYDRGDRLPRMRTLERKTTQGARQEYFEVELDQGEVQLRDRALVA